MNSKKNTSRLTVASLLSTLLALPANFAGAAVQGWNPNGTTSIGGNGTWDTTSALWTPGGTQTQVASGSLVPFAPGNAALFCAGPSGSANQGTFTITVSGTISIGGIFNGNLNPGPCNVTITGGGLSLAPGTDAFSMFNDTTTINTPISGTGVLNPQGSGSVSLYANNSYSGGTLLNAGTLVNFNNNNSFGTGLITVNRTSGNFAALLGTLGAPITLPNNFTNITAGGGVNFGTSANTPITCTGNWGLGATLNLRNNGNATAPLTLTGVISGAGGLSLTANNNGLIALSGANTYTGQTSISGGSSGVTLSVSSINSVSGGSPSSSLGHPATIANGTIAIGSGANTCTLIYTGVGETSDRVINLAGTTGGAILQADGSGALIFSSTNNATGAGVKTITLQGTNTAGNSIGKIINNTSPTSVVKAQSGNWILSSNNTYTGGTTVNGGSLEIAGSVAGSVTNNSGVLTLDTTTTMPSTANLAVSSGTTVNLNFTGTNAINALFIDGNQMVSGTWGSPTSTAQNQNPIFSGNGVIKVQGAPLIIQQPQSLTIYPDRTATFSIVVNGDPSFTYQWKFNGTNIPGANDSTYVISPAEAVNAGTYSVAITNNFGFTNSANATLTILATNDYVNAVLANNPVAYWRLDETNGTIAHDWVGLHQGVYVNARLNQPGFSVIPGSDPAMGIPVNTNKGIMVISNASPDFSFPTASATPTFTLEAWGMSTNFAANVKQRLISTLTTSGAGGYGFGIPDSQHIQFTAGGVDDWDATLSTPLAAGVWYHFVVTCDGNNFALYLNGNPVGTTNNSSGFNVPASPGQLNLGNNPLSYPGEQFFGAIDEVAIYNVALDQTTITNHYLARYSDLAAPTTTTPVVSPPTNYVSLSATLTESAGGAGLTYQWYRGNGFGSPIADGTSSTLTLGPLQFSDATNYHCLVTDAGSQTSDSPLSASLVVLSIPTNAADLNLTNGLVLHLPFDSDYKDISGRVNDGTPVGSPALNGFGQIGSGALHYGATNGVATNYVTLGVRPDFQFSSNIDFTVAYWVRGTVNTNLPFFCDSTNGLAGILAQQGGYYFGPNTSGNGGWAVGVGSTAHAMSTSGGSIINDGNWHHLAHVVKRTGNVTTYVDGSEVDSHAVSFVSDSINTANPANIGQDGTGAQVFAQDQEGNIDDLAVWRRTLTQLEVSGIYLAGISNNVSFAPPVSNPIIRVALQIQQVAPGQYQIVWTGPGTLTASGDVLGTYTNVPSATSPYTIPTSSGPQLFYRLKY